ncbi:MAG: hypothetical protein NTZ41_07845 [Sphingobacteriales bacterium]|nr:hypothetical protein [Sphingobacteriales bacterium]
MNKSFDVEDKLVFEKPTTAGKLFSIFFSWVFHPVFMPLYVSMFLLYVHPDAFAGFSAMAKKQTLLIVVLNLIAFPVISVLLLKALGFIDSFFLRTRKDRIIPYIASGIFFFWAYTVFRQQPQYPLLFTAYVFGIFLASSAALLANIYFKVSMHAIGLGGLLGFFLILLFHQSMLMSWPLSLALLITGMVCSARLVGGHHQPFDIYAGLLLGIFTQLIASWVLV